MTDLFHRIELQHGVVPRHYCRVDPSIILGSFEINIPLASSTNESFRIIFREEKISVANRFTRQGTDCGKHYLNCDEQKC